MKKRIKGGLCIFASLVLIISLFSTVFSGTDENWVKVSDDMYIQLPNSNGTVLIRETQDRDIIKIADELTSKYRLDSKDNSSIQNPLVIDDVNFEFEKEAAIGNLFVQNSEISLLTSGKIQSIPQKKYNVSIENSAGELSIGMQKVVIDGKTISVPQSLRYLPYSYIISDDGGLAILSTETGFWAIDQKGNVVKASDDYYNGESYEQLSIIFAKNHGEVGNIFWNEQIKINPDNSMVSYVSNKDCLDSKGQSLYMYDMSTNVETILVKSGGDDAYINRGWLNSDYILCEKWTDKDDTQEFFAISTAGDKIELGSENSKMLYVLDVKGNYVAYLTDGMGGSQISIFKFNGENLSLEFVQSIELHGHSVNQGKFSDDCSLFGTIWSPSDGKAELHIKVADLSSSKETIIGTLPKGDGISIVTDFSFLKDNNLLINLGDVTDKVTEISTWIYTL